MYQGRLMAKTLFNKSKKQKLPVSDTISEEFIKQLLIRQEGVNLDFKREMYKISFKDYKNDHINIDEKDRKERIKQEIKQQKGELIKDILSLANRNVANVADTSYLIVGAANQQDEDENRKLFSITYEIPESKDLLQLINYYCEPSLDNLYCNKITINGKLLWIVTIPPTRYLHETTQELWCKRVQGATNNSNNNVENTKPRYSIRTVFIRNGESIQVATMKERITIEEAKENFYKQSNSLNLSIFGFILGILIGSPMGVTNAKLTNTNPTIGFFVGMVIIGMLGAIIGYNIHQIQEIIFSFSSYKTWQKVLFILLFIMLFVWFIFVYGRMALGY
jgi:F0F1-type ATP synthase assembly protein I